MKTVHKIKNRAALLLTLVLVAGLMGCAPKSSPEPSVSAELPTTPPASASSESSPPSTGDAALYEKYGLTIAIPNDYIDQLIVIDKPEWEMLADTTLISVWEKRSYEDSKADYGEDATGGFMFTIARYTRAQYEQFLSSDGSGQSFFARDDTYYYGWFTATDVQFYRSGGVIDTESDGWKEWEALWDKCNRIKDDFIARNHLRSYSDSEFFDMDFTWDSAHLYLTYYPYYAYQDTAENQGFTWEDKAYTLVLSQPAAQGASGIWCVERWYDDYGTLYYEFPGAPGIAAANWYAALQQDAGNGDASLLTPENAALDFVREHFDHQAATADSFRPLEGEPAGNVWKLCRQVFDDMGVLQAGYYLNGQAGAREQYQVPENLKPFSSYAGSRLYPIIWLKAGEPPVKTGDVVFCRNSSDSKVLSFYKDENLLCVNLGGSSQWFRPAYTYDPSPYDRMLDFYAQFESSYKSDSTGDPEP